MCRHVLGLPSTSCSTCCELLCPRRKVHPPSALVPHVSGEPVLPVWLPQCSLGMAAALLVGPLPSGLLHTGVDSVGGCGQALRQPRNGAVVVHRPPGLGQREGLLLAYLVIRDSWCPF